MATENPVRFLRCPVRSREDFKPHILVRPGMIQHLFQDGKRGMLVALSFDAAKKARTELKAKGATIAEIGSIPGETFEVQVAAAIEVGAEGCWATDGEKLDWWPVEVAA